MQFSHLYLACLLAAIFTVSVKSKPAEQDDTMYEDEPDEPEYTDGAEGPPEESNAPRENVKVVILTKPEIFAPKIGENVTLPCEMSNAAECVVVWSKSDKILFQGGIKVTESKYDQRPNYSFYIPNVTVSDSGEYTCKCLISNEGSPQVSHKVEVQQPPKISHIYTIPNKTSFAQKENVEIICEANGIPEPQITWYKGAEKGERIGNGNKLNIEVTVKSAGTYRCIADNDIGDPSHKHIEINVEHKPIVSIEKYTVNSDKELDAELKCSVNAYPHPVVSWQKNGMNIVSNPPHITTSNKRNHYSLHIKQMTEDDFGTYTCFAKNTLGKTEKNATIVKTPSIQEFVKPSKGKKDVSLVWKLESKVPLTEHELQYRMKGESDWHNLKPEIKQEGNDVYTLNYTLKDLESGIYETRVRSSNKHGWSEYSEDAFENVVKHSSHHKHLNRKQHKNKDAQVKQTKSIQESTPAEHQEKDIKGTAAPQETQENDSVKEFSAGELQTGGQSIAMSSTFIISIGLLIISVFNNRL